MNAYRVFIAYSHQNKQLAQKVAAILKKNRLIPMMDREFKIGLGFPDQIKKCIAHAHVFLPLITKDSSERGWVHQEIGYATALNIPILPVCLGQALPDEMIRDKHAVMLRGDSQKDYQKLKRELSARKIEDLVSSPHETQFSAYESAELHEDRTAKMADFARHVLSMGHHGHVRQRGALSSFHIPDKRLDHGIWKQRYGKYYPGEHRCKLLLEERRELEKHARKRGCSLIVDPTLDYNKYGLEARAARLRTLLEFLKDKSIPNSKITIAINKGMPRAHSLTLVGDWFSAESVSASIGEGYRQTIFTRHAPSVISKIKIFDLELHELLNEQGIKPSASRGGAIKEIENILEGRG